MNVLITGGTSGLGEAVTRKIARELDGNIYFTYCKSGAKAKEIEADHPNSFSIKCDFKNNTEIENLKDKIGQLDLDVLINNAYTGDVIKSYFHKIDTGDFLDDFKNNIIPTVIITQAAINIFRKKKFGKIITVLTSALINTPPLGSSVYVANKAYLEELTKIWAVENIKYNITSNAISPAFMLTGFTNYTDERVIEQMVTDHPLKKLLTPEEVAVSVSFLVKAPQQINGINLIVNSGATIK